VGRSFVLVTHRAVAFTSQGRAELVPVEPPGPPGPNGVSGPTLATLISPGTELAVGYREGAFPLYPGYAAAFRAETIGERVEGVRPGDVLFCMGPHRSFQSAGDSEVVKVPDGLPPEQAVLARLMGVSMTTLTTAAARPGNLVLVSGAGPGGYLAAHVFRAAGYEILSAEPDAGRREGLRGSGVARVFPAIPVDDPDIAGRVALVVECSGHETAVLDACRVVRKRGEVVMVGVPWTRRTDLYLHGLLHAVFHRYVVLRSGWEWELPPHASDFRPHGLFENFRTALRWLSEGRIPVGDRLTVLPADDAPSAYERLNRGEFPGLFPVLDWSLRS
jgi:threonine dehydrogenase-like Zn-dependent dehydrogenase